MADSLEDLGGYDLFPIEPNWAVTPKGDLDLAKELINYPGTVSQLIGFTYDVPEVWSFGFSPDKDEEYDLINFFVGKYGRTGAFWMKLPHTEFTLTTTALSGSTELRVERNLAERQYQGYERVWIDMHTGDILTREVNDTTDETTYLSLSLTTSLDRDITLTNHYKICRLLFCRFDEDALIMNYSQDYYPQITIYVRELVKEYP